MVEDAGYGTDDENKRTSRPAARRKSNLYEQDARPPSGKVKRQNSADSASRRAANPPTNHSGINKDVVARMSQRYADEDDTEADDEGEMYGYDYNQYSNPTKNNKHKRRVSTSSCSQQRRMSTSSRTSRASRRRSTCSHMKKDPLEGLYPNNHPDDSDSSHGYESDAQYSTSGQSIASMATRQRRSSCLAAIASHMDYNFDMVNATPKAVQKRTGCAGSDDEAADDGELLYGPQSETPNTVANTTASTNVKLTRNALAKAEPGSQTPLDFRKRKDPLTTSHAVPTFTNMVGEVSAKHAPNGEAPSMKKKSNDVWGNLALNEDAEPLSSDELTSEKSFGATLYTNTTVYRELDEHKQKARRRDSLVNTCFTISPDTGTRFKFKPADGCNNASDFLVRCFTARLRISGFTVLKHNRSRWSKAKHRVIYLLPDGKTLTWKDADDEQKKEEEEDMVKSRRSRKHNSRPKIDLSTVVEVRHAWTPDPLAKNKHGTPILRNRCKDSVLSGKSFSLIFAKRSVDLTAFSNDQCKILMEGFSALVFRLKQIKCKDKACDVECSQEMDEDDWACSTVYGGGTGSISASIVTPSLTNTTTNSASKAAKVVATSPWGV